MNFQQAEIVTRAFIEYRNSRSDSAFRNFYNLTLEDIKRKINYYKTMRLDSNTQYRIDESDVLQSVYFKIISHAGSYKEEMLFMPWLNTLIKNMFYSEVGKLNHDGKMLGIQSFEDDAEPSSLTETIDRIQSRSVDASYDPNVSLKKEIAIAKLFNLVVETIKEIPDLDTKRILYLHKIEGMPYNEIAKLLDKNPVTVRGLSARGMQKLMELLSKKIDFEEVRECIFL
jgi:RNA polymerase sigma factor (sigma-70 family)